MIKIINVVVNLRVSSGVSNFIINNFRHMDLDRFKIDFMEIEPMNSAFREIVANKGSIIYKMPSKKNFTKYKCAIDQVFKKNKYDIVHVHVLGPSAAIVLNSAKVNGVKTRVLHSHMIGSVKSFFPTLKENVFKKISCYYATDFFACSYEAGIDLFKKDFKIIKNGIDYDQFKFSENIRKQKRTELNMKDEIIIGTVCRIVPEKNPYFMIDVIKNLYKINDNIRFIWIGSGLLDSEIKQYVEKNGLKKIVNFLGSRNDVNEWYQAMDVFLMPSLYEGFGISYIEAQLAGLRTYASEAVPKSTKISDLINYISLDKSASEWAEIINTNLSVKNREYYFQGGCDDIYNIGRCVYDLETAYDKSVKRNS